MSEAGRVWPRRRLPGVVVHPWRDLARVLFDVSVGELSRDGREWRPDVTASRGAGGGPREDTLAMSQDKDGG